MGSLPVPTEFSALTLTDMLEAVKRAEARRQASCRSSAISYLRRRAREAGLSIEEYTKTLDPRGKKRKHFPEGVFTPEQRPPQREVLERIRAKKATVPV